MTAVESTEIGGAIGRIKADDPDIGRNAELEYTIVGGHDTFNIITDQTTQEGVLIIKKVLVSTYFSLFIRSDLCCVLFPLIDCIVFRSSEPGSASSLVAN